MKTKSTGIAIAIAWPETYCKQAGSWYDPIMLRVGISKHYYYRAGHAALVLVESVSGHCYYFDFGRYHAPFQFGRVRSAATDPGLAVKTKAVISEDGTKILNFSDILLELQQNPECHGDGTIHASFIPLDFHIAIEKSLEMQQRSPIPYGPFVFGGSNCSRFVQTVILAGKPKFWSAQKIKFLLPFTPTPMSNVKALPNRTAIAKLLATPNYCPKPVKKPKWLKTTIPAPDKHPGIPSNAQWLSGEGAGSWFSIVSENDSYVIIRYNSNGEIECSGKFKQHGKKVFDANAPYRFEHLSHCRKVHIRQDDIMFEFNDV